MSTRSLIPASLAALLALSLPLAAQDNSAAAADGEAQELADAAADLAKEAEAAADQADAAVEEATDKAEEAADMAVAAPGTAGAEITEANQAAAEAADAVRDATAAEDAAEAAQESASAAAEVAADAQDAVETADTTTWVFDPDHSYIGFRIQHFGLTEVIGSFRKFSGTIAADKAAPTASSVTFTAEVASIDSGVEARDEHLRGTDFFDATQFPEITFASTAVKETDDGFTVTGDLTIKGTTQSVDIPLTVNGPVEGMQGEQRLGAHGQLTIDRTTFKVGEANPALASEVTIDLQVEATQD